MEGLVRFIILVVVLMWAATMATALVVGIWAAVKFLG